MVRRAIVKNPDFQHILTDIINHYAETEYVGTNFCEVIEGKTIPAPAPGNKGRKAWRPAYNPHGPVGLLLTQVHKKRCCRLRRPRCPQFWLAEFEHNVMSLPRAQTSHHAHSDGGQNLGGGQHTQVKYAAL